jgi:hypothetical protein
VKHGEWIDVFWISLLCLVVCNTKEIFYQTLTWALIFKQPEGERGICVKQYLCMKCFWYLSLLLPLPLLLSVGWSHLWSITSIKYVLLKLLFARISWVCVCVHRRFSGIAIRPWLKQNFKLLSWMFLHIRAPRLFNLFSPKTLEDSHNLQFSCLWINLWIQIIGGWT